MKSTRFSLALLFVFSLLIPAVFACPPVHPPTPCASNVWYVNQKTDSWVCKVHPAPTPKPKPTPNPIPGPITVTSGSSSTSGANSTANGGNSTATGGNATGGNSNSSSGVSNSGNSSNKNTNTAQGGTSTANGNGSNNKTTATGGTVSGSGNSTQGQKQSQTQSNSSTNNNANQANGNGSNSNNTTNNVAAAKIPVATAYAPTALPTVPCFKSYSGGGQAANFGFSVGGGKVDENCAQLEVARSFDLAGERLAACKVKVSTKYAKAAGVTLEDCLKATDTPVVGDVAPTTTPVVPFVVVPRLATPEIPVAALPIPTLTVPITPSFLGFVTVYNNVTKAKLDDVVALARQDVNGHLRLRAGRNSLGLADSMKAYLTTNEVTSNRVEIRDDGDNHGVELLWISGN